MPWIYWNVMSQNDVLMRTQLMHVKLPKSGKYRRFLTERQTPNGLDHISRERVTNNYDRLYECWGD
jgi:hypothetical protein